MEPSDDLAQHRLVAAVATVAIAREMAGWCWSLATIEDDTTMS